MPKLKDVVPPGAVFRRFTVRWGIIDTAYIYICMYITYVDVYILHMWIACGMVVVSMIFVRGVCDDE